MPPPPIDLTPLPRLIQAVRQQGLTLTDCLSEFIDNSFDAGATTVQLTWDKGEDYLEIEDNGQGCADITTMVRMAAFGRPRPTVSPPDLLPRLLH
jgi:Histidine kinase-, DNA gyrase B-, and HSP90-like ATPase